MDGQGGAGNSGAASGGQETPVSSAPYMSYKGFKNYLSRFRDEGLPDRLDGSYFGNASGSLVAQVRGSLSGLGLIDADKAPTDALRELAAASDGEQASLLADILHRTYPDALDLSKTATSGQLSDTFRARGLSGATVQKAISFFVNMAEDAGVEVSPHFRKGRAAGTSGGGTLKRRRSTKVSKPRDPAPPQQADGFGGQRAAYVEMLMDLAQREGADADTQVGLLDRIERALGLRDEKDK